MNINTLVESFYKTTHKDDLINEVLQFLLAEKKNTEKEPRPPAPGTTRRARMLRFPLIIPTEQSVGQYTATEGSEDRATFEVWMKKIAKGGDLKDKIAAIQQFIESPEEGMTVAKTLSYLMFLQTFSYMIREFNASVAGFLWEPFLAAMFGGKSTQVHTEEGDIADVKLELEYSILTDQMGGGLQRVSLKILSPTGAVGGSFVDLVNHFAKNPEQPMVYVVIRKMPGKTKAGQDIKEATMVFWEFTISQESFFKWIGPPKLAIQRKTIEYEHAEDAGPPPTRDKKAPPDAPPHWGRKDLEMYLASDKSPLESGWIVTRVEKDGVLVPLGGPGAIIVPGETYEIQMKTATKIPGAAGERRHAEGQGAAGRIWGSPDQYAEWYALWKSMPNDPKFWQYVRGPQLLRTKDDDTGPPALSEEEMLREVPFAPKGAQGYWDKEQFEIGSTYQAAASSGDIGTINILPSVMEETFARGAEMIGDDLTEMFNALSALIDNVGRFFLIECGDPQAKTKTCDEKDAATRSTAGRAAIEDATTLKRVVDDRIATEFARQDATDPAAGLGGAKSWEE